MLVMIKTKNKSKVVEVFQLCPLSHLPYQVKLQLPLKLKKIETIRWLFSKKHNGFLYKTPKAFNNNSDAKIQFYAIFHDWLKFCTN